MNRRELATVLAALRLWQRGDAIGDDGDEELERIATDGGELEPLTDEEVDKLCIDLNCPEHEWVDATNEVVSGGDICVKCGALRSHGERP